MWTNFYRNHTVEMIYATLWQNKEHLKVMPIAETDEESILNDQIC